jgi:hypothetical protein
MFPLLTDSSSLSNSVPFRFRSCHFHFDFGFHLKDLSKGSKMTNITSSPPGAFTFQPKSGMVPSIEDYKAFHGMVCGLRASKRCIDSFDGCTIFADRSEIESDKDISNFDYSRTWPLGFNLCSYYCLVLLSLTGLCSLLGKTQLLVVRDENSKTIVSKETVIFASESHKHLRVPAKVIDYMMERSRVLSPTTEDDPEIMLHRRFEFNFGGHLSVVMFHFVCSNGQKYLVEVYDWADTWPGKIAYTCVTAVRKLQSMLQSVSKSKEE